MSNRADRSCSLSFNRMDIEKRLGFPAGRFTQPGPVLSILAAVIVAIAFYLALNLFPEERLAQSFLERGPVPYGTVALASWALMIIFIKSRKISLQRRALRHAVSPVDPEFVLTRDNVGQIMDRLYEIAEEPKHFLLYNRIHFSLANLKNIGRIGDVDEILRTRAEHDEAAVESSYTILRGLIWGIPVLGFIGTVQGLSGAIGDFGKVIADTSEMTQIRSGLKDVIGNLGVAFETTFQALVFALAIQLLMTLVKRTEEQMLDEFIEYCDRHVVGRLRLIENRATDDVNDEVQPTP